MLNKHENEGNIVPMPKRDDSILQQRLDVIADKVIVTSTIKDLKQCVSDLISLIKSIN